MRGSGAWLLQGPQLAALAAAFLALAGGAAAAGVLALRAWRAARRRAARCSVAIDGVEAAPSARASFTRLFRWSLMGGDGPLVAEDAAVAPFPHKDSVTGQLRGGLSPGAGKRPKAGRPVAIFAIQRGSIRGLVLPAGGGGGGSSKQAAGPGEGEKPRLPARGRAMRLPPIEGAVAQVRRPSKLASARQLPLRLTHSSAPSDSEPAGEGLGGGGQQQLEGAESAAEEGCGRWGGQGATWAPGIPYPEWAAARAEDLASAARALAAADDSDAAVSDSDSRSAQDDGTFRVGCSEHELSRLPWPAAAPDGPIKPEGGSARRAWGSGTAAPGPDGHAQLAGGVLLSL